MRSLLNLTLVLMVTICAHGRKLRAPAPTAFDKTAAALAPAASNRFGTLASARLASQFMAQEPQPDTAPVAGPAEQAMYAVAEIVAETTGDGDEAMRAAEEVAANNM